MNRKFKLGEKLRVPLMRDSVGSPTAPVYSDKEPNSKIILESLLKSKAIDNYVDLEICGYYDGNYNGLNSPYLFKITPNNKHHFKNAALSPDAILGTKFSHLTPGMQALTLRSVGTSEDDYFYAIEKDLVEKYLSPQAAIPVSKQEEVSKPKQEEVIQPQSKEIPTMSNTKTPGQIFKSDLDKAAYRTAARQTAKVAKTAILSVVKSKSGDKRKGNKTASALQEVLDTDLGTYGISEALGWALTYAPGLKEHPNAQRLAEELRVEGLAGAGDLALDKLFQTLVPSMVSVLNTLPSVEAAKTAEMPAVKEQEKQEVELEVVTLSAQNAK